jgi:L-fucose isomerase-like protein
MAASRAAAAAIFEAVFIVVSFVIEGVLLLARQRRSLRWPRSRMPHWAFKDQFAERDSAVTKRQKNHASILQARLRARARLRLAGATAAVRASAPAGSKLICINVQSALAPIMSPGFSTERPH